MAQLFPGKNVDPQKINQFSDELNELCEYYQVDLMPVIVVNNKVPPKREKDKEKKNG